MKLRFVGTGAAGGVPLYGCQCRACERAMITQEHRREPASLLIETEQQQVLIDAGLPELGRRFPAGSLQAILLTHFHMDHVQGLFHIRWGTNIRLPVIGPDDPKGADDLLKHPGILDFSQKSVAFQPFVLGDLRITPLPLTHSRPTLGYVIEHQGRRLAYLTDTVGLPEPTSEWLCANPPDLLILDCSHPPRELAARNHNDLHSALDTVQTLGASATLLTHISHQLDHWRLQNPHLELPQGVEFARDRLEWRL